MESFERIFQSKLTQVQQDSRLPIACSLHDVFHTQKSLMMSARIRKESIEQKNRKIAEESLKYREQLQKKITLLQQKHDKNRKEALIKVVKSQERRKDYRKDIFSRHKQGEKEALRKKLGKFKEHAQQMQDYWKEKKLNTEHSFRSQSAVRPLYWQSVERKRGLQREESQKGAQVKSDLLQRHEGREEKVHRLHEQKQEQVHEVHKEQISQVLKKNNEILDARITALINRIGEDFSKSEDVLQGQAKAQTKRFKDRKIDDYDHRLTVKSNLLDRTRQRASSLSECACKRINNVEEGAVPSIKEQSRHVHFGDTLRKLEREPSETRSRNTQFLTRSYSFRSTVSYNQSLLSQRKHNADTDRLRREAEIAKSLALRKHIQVEGNCHLRKTVVK